MTCESHPENVALCSCGYSRELPPVPMVELPKPMPRARLSEIWSGLDEVGRAIWVYWLDLAKPFERDTGSAATLAASKALAWASRRG